MTVKRTAVLAALGVAAVAGATLAATGVGGGKGPAAAHSTLPPATAAIERSTMTATEKVDGVLGYGDTRTVSAGGRGTLTWIAASGATVKRGEPVYRVDTHPVPLLYGTLPLYRALKVGTSGSDVRQLERNLRALGYTGFTVDKEFGSGTAAAVRRWQDDLGLPTTGSVAPGSVVLAPGAIRIAQHRKSAGSPAGGGPLLTCTGTTQVVTVSLDVGLRKLAEKGASVRLSSDDGSTTGTITKIGTVATRPSRDSDTSTVKVTVSVKNQKALGGFDQAPVDVRLTSEQHRDVLSVPVSALLALPRGGYGVQVVSGTTARTVPVQTGIFAESRVEILGAGLSDGMKVGIPA